MREATTIDQTALAAVAPVDPKALAVADAALPADVCPVSGAVAGGGTLRDARTVLLTGVTGFLGRWIAHALLTQSSAAIVCLVRGSEGEAGDRVREALATTGLDTARVASRVAVVGADLAKPALALDPNAAAALSERVDAICHAGATVNWVQSYAQLRAANVIGTLELLRIAARRGTPFHFVSSLSVCYSTMAPLAVDERYDALADLDGLHLGYAQTKAVAEALVREAGRRGLAVSIYRPSLISGHSETGAFNRDDILARVVRGCVAMGTAPDLDWSLDCLPVDVAAHHIVATAPREHAVDAVHLAHRRPRDWRECVLWLRLSGYDVRLVPYARWLRQLEAETAATRDRTHPLRPLRAFFLRRVSDRDGRTMPELLTGSDRDFGVSDTIGPPLDAVLLQRYCDAFVASGDLPAVATLTTPAAAAADPVRIDADFFTRVIGQPVSRAEPRGRLSAHSIISELTSWRSGRATGLFPYRLRLAGGDREVIVKVKSRDGDVIAVGEALARICDASLADAYTRWSDRLGVLGAGRREQAIYAQKDPRFLAHAPALLGSTVDPVSGAVTLVIERITDALVHDSPPDPSGTAPSWTPVHDSPPDASWTPACVDCAIRGLAALQAIWIGRTAALEREPWIGHVPSASSVAEMADFWYALASHARPRLTDWTDGSITSLQERLIDTAGTWWRGLETGPRTLIHNDFNPRNVCIRDSQRGPRLAAYDWELATIGAPQHDLAELLCFVLPPRATRAEAAGWIERHRGLLERESGLHLDRDEWEYGFRASVRDLMLNRLPMYCLVDRVRRQPFLPRVVRTWWRIHEWFPL